MCVAGDPADTGVLLGAHPAANTTHRRRVAVIGAAHDRHSLTSPARGEAVRAAIDTARTERMHELASRLGAIVAQLPASGWPAALFARRDALILVLPSTGLPYTAIADLRVRDVTYGLTGDVLHVDTAAASAHALRLLSPELGYHHLSCCDGGAKSSAF